eukprot:3756192-Amphidinium_carterae.1
MHLFRQAIAIEVDKRLVIKRGRVTDEAKSHRLAMLALFIDWGRSPLVRHLLLNTALNGDWRVSSCIEHWIAEDAPTPQRETIVWSVQSAVLASLTDAQPTLYPRHRWVGGEQAIADLGILMAVHNLLHPTYQTFLHLLSSGACASGMDNTNLAAEEPTDIAPLAEGPHDPLAIFETEAVESLVPHSMPQSSGLAESSDAQRIENEKMRQSAVAWMKTLPFARIVIMKLVVSPLAVLIKEQLW